MMSTSELRDARPQGQAEAREGLTVAELKQLADRAVACTATGEHSGFPKWSYLPGMFVEPIHDPLDGECFDLPGRIVAVHGDTLALCNIEGDLVTVYASRMRPDMRDRLTEQGLYLLAVRAWKGRRLMLTEYEDGSVSLMIFVPDSPKGADFSAEGERVDVFVRALEAAPCKT